MSLGGSLGVVARVLIETVIVAALPIAATKLAGRISRSVRPHDFFEVPLVAGLARLLGVALGVALLYARYGRRYFDPHTLFTPQSPWNLSFWQFLGERANPLNYGIGTLVDNPAGRMGEAGFLVPAALAALLLLATVVAPFLFWEPRLARRAAILALALAVFVAYLTIYAICLFLWSLYLLNFWTIAVLIVMFQYYRGRARHVLR